MHKKGTIYIYIYTYFYSTTIDIYSRNRGRHIGGGMLLYARQSTEVKANLMVGSGVVFV